MSKSSVSEYRNIYTIRHIGLSDTQMSKSDISESIVSNLSKRVAVDDDTSVKSLRTRDDMRAKGG